MDKATIAGRKTTRQVSWDITRGTLVLSIFVLYLIGTHLRLSIYADGSILLPMYLMVLSAAMFSFLFMNRLLRYTGISLTIFAAFILTQPALTLAPESISFGTFLGSLQLLVSVISALAVIYALSTVDRARLRCLLIVIWCVVMALAIVEYAGLKPVFDQARETLYSGSDRFVYFAELRDLEIYGQVRTTAFASEPSFLADTLSALALMIFFLDPQRGRFWSWLRLAFIIAASFTLTPSFKIAFYLLAALVWQFWPRDQRGFVIILSSLFVLNVLLLILFEPIYGLLVEAVGGYVESGSFYGRIVIGPTVGWNVLTTYPIYGYGIGNEEGLYPVIAQVWQGSGAFQLFPWYLDLPATDLMTNGFWWQWIFLGAGGGLIFTMLTLRLLSQIGVEMPLRTLVCTWIVWYSGFAFVDPLSWYVVVVFAVGAVPPRKAVRNQHIDGTK